MRPLRLPQRSFWLTQIPLCLSLQMGGSQANDSEDDDSDGAKSMGGCGAGGGGGQGSSSKTTEIFIEASV